MDIFTFTDGLQQQLRTLAESGASKEPLTQCSEMMGLVEELMGDLQQFTYNYTFATPAEEIRFFKKVKPVLLSQYYYYKTLFDITLFDSFRDESSKRKYYQSLLDKLETFARRNSEFYRYCMTGQTSLDDRYFIRSRKLFSGLIDTRSSTWYDAKLARLLANELIRKYLLDLIAKQERSASSITWTGNKTDAIELLAALHSSETFNNGDIDLRKLIQAFEVFFNIRLDNYYDFLKNIRMRKGGRTNFLDQLKNKFIQRIDQMEK